MISAHYGCSDVFISVVNLFMIQISEHVHCMRRIRIRIFTSGLLDGRGLKRYCKALNAEIQLRLPFSQIVFNRHSSSSFWQPWYSSCKKGGRGEEEEGGEERWKIVAGFYASVVVSLMFNRL